MSIATLLRMKQPFGRSRKPAPTKQQPAANGVRETPANAVRREPKAPAPEPYPRAAAERHDRRHLLASTMLREGVPAGQIPTLLGELEGAGLEAFEHKLEAVVKVPKAAQATAERIAARGDFVFFDPKAFAADHLARGSSVEHVMALLADIEAAPGIPLPDYERLYPADGQEGEKARIAAKLNAEADAMEAHWSGQGATPKTAGAPPAPTQQGYFICDAVPGFPRRQPEEGPTNGQ